MEYLSERARRGFFLECDALGYMRFTISYLTDPYDSIAILKDRHSSVIFELGRKEDFENQEAFRTKLVTSPLRILKKGTL